jgi:uncharacterized protein YdaU (DUF1376 family)
MHYYQFNIGDYQSHTKHLSPTEDICYRRLLDFYYLHESPIQNDLIKITRLLCLNKEYLSDVESVLSEFFTLTDDGWINHRANKEIEQYQSFSEAGKRGAAKRWSKAGDKEAIGGLSGGVPKANAKQEPRTNNHKPLTINQETISKICLSLKNNGIIDLNQTNPTFIKLIEAGATEQEFIDCTKESKVKKFNYILGMMKGRRDEANELNLKTGTMKMKGYGFVSDQQFNDWLESTPTQERIANE